MLNFLSLSGARNGFVCGFAITDLLGETSHSSSLYAIQMPQSARKCVSEMRDESRLRNFQVREMQCRTHIVLRAGVVGDVLVSADLA